VALSVLYMPISLDSSFGGPRGVEVSYERGSPITRQTSAMVGHVTPQVLLHVNWFPFPGTLTAIAQHLSSHCFLPGLVSGFD